MDQERKQAISTRFDLAQGFHREIKEIDPEFGK